MTPYQKAIEILERAAAEGVARHSAGVRPEPQDTPNNGGYVPTREDWLEYEQWLDSLEGDDTP